MSCRRWQEALSLLIDDELPEQRRSELREHLERCPACRQLETELRVLRETAAALGDHEPRREMLHDALRALDHQPQHRSSPRRWSVRGLAAAGVLGLAVATGALVLSGDRQGADPELQRPGGAHHRRVDVTARRAERELLAAVARELRRPDARYRRDIELLRRIAHQESRRWAVRTRDRYRRELAVIDAAVATCRTAAQLSPADPSVREVLFAAYREQISYLQDAILAGASARAFKTARATPAAAMQRQR